MVNEVVMYQSMFLLGVIMFGFFATSFNNYSDFAESVTLDNNLDRVLQEISQEIINLLNHAAQLRGNSGTITISIQISLDSEYATEPYIITTPGTGEGILIAIVGSDEVARLPLNLNSGVVSDFDERTINFSGSMSSSSFNTQITYNFDGLSENIVFSS